MCFGGGDTTSTVNQIPAQKSPEEQQAIQLALESLRMRQSLMPFLMENVGIGQDAGGNMARLPPTPQQQQINTLTSSSLGGANEASQMLLSRLRRSDAMIPGLMSSVRASMAPGTRGSFMPSAIQPPNTGQMQGGQAGQFQGGPMAGQGGQVGEVTRFDPARMPQSAGPLLAAGGLGLGAGTTTKTKGGQAGSLLPILPLAALPLIRKLLGKGVTLPLPLPGVGVSPGMSEMFGKYGEVPPPPGTGPFPLTNPPPPVDPTQFSFGVEPSFTNIPPTPGIGAMGAAGAGGGAFGPSIAGSIDSGLLSGAGGMGITSPVTEGLAGLSDFVPSWFGGTGAAVGPMGAFAAPLMMAITSQIAAGQHDDAIKQRGIRRQQAWEQANPGQYLFGPNTRLDFGNTGWGTQIIDEGRWRADLKQLEANFYRYKDELITSGLPENEILARLADWEKIPQNMNATLWDPNSVASQMQRGTFPQYNPDTPEGSLYALVQQVVDRMTPGKPAYEMNQPGFNLTPPTFGMPGGGGQRILTGL